MKPRSISISVQISIFLVIIAFLPVAAAMALKTYEKQLLEQLENSNVQQARLVSAGLADVSLDAQKARNLLLNMNGRFDARIRILNADASLVADSAVLQNQNDEAKSDDENEFASDFETGGQAGAENKISESSGKNASETFVYNLFSRPVRIYRKYFKPPRAVPLSEDYYSVHSVFDGEEIAAALEGKYGAATRISSGGQVSVNLYSAVPIINLRQKNQNDGNVIGVVLVSRSTYKILQNLYELRLDLGKIFLWSLLAVALIAVFLTFRISLPLRKLSRQSAGCADKKGRVLTTEFTGSRRHDEIGGLSRSFKSLVEKLNLRIKFAESFASDVSHEFKNPLAAIRACTEFLSDSSLSGEERAQFVSAINEEVSHLQNLLTGVRNITKIDSDASNDENQRQKVNLHQFAENIVKRMELAFPKTRFYIEENGFDGNAEIFVNGNYLDRLSENLLSNAADFGEKVIFEIDFDGKNLEISVDDNGKGVQDEEKNKIFERFYSNRPDEEKSAHTGLGLATVKAILDFYGGEIKVAKSEKLGGAKFTARFQI